MLIKYWLALLDELKGTACCQGYWSVSMGLKMQSTERDALFIFLTSSVLCRFAAWIRTNPHETPPKTSSWSDVRKYCLWNRWIRKLDQLSQRLKEQACERSTQPRPFCYLPCGLSVVASSLVLIMHRRFPVRLNRVFQYQQAFYRLPLPSIQITPCK